jgi:uncharacterized RDD family membrane protein YckC
MTTRLAAWSIIALFMALASPALAGPRDLLAASSPAAIFVARVLPPDKTDPDASTERTLLISRLIGKETRWRKLALLSGRVISLAASDVDAKVLLDSGDWLTIWGDGQTIGPSPDHVRLRALAADGGDLWALGVPVPDASPDTAPAATRSVAVPVTTTAVGPQEPGIYRFDGQRWSRAMPLPEGARFDDPSAISLAILEHRPVLAMTDNSRLRVWSAATANGDDEKWEPAPAPIDASAPIYNFNLISAGLPPTLWLTTGGAGVLITDGHQRALAPDGAEAAHPRAVIRAADAIRDFAASGDQIYQQDYGADGKSTDRPAPLAIDLVSPDSQLQLWITPAFTIVVTLLVFGASRSGGAAQPPAALIQANLILAPLLPRFIAGVIDAVPVLFAIVYSAYQMSLQPQTGDMPTPQQAMPFYMGCAFYLGYVIVAEAAFGQTLGKWLFGLRIVNLDGTRPSLSAIIARNLLRLIDLVLMWMPLAIMLFSPLRQRAGDIAAGTLVARPMAKAS